MYWVNQIGFTTLEAAIEYIEEEMEDIDFDLNDYKIIEGEEVRVKLKVTLDTSD